MAMTFRGRAGALAWLERRAEDVIAALLGIMFVAFVVQIVFRYFFDLPTGWTSELSVITWLWLVLWGAAFVLRDEEEIRFDLVYSTVGTRTRRAMGLAFAVAIVVLYAASLPATWSYVTFMKVESTSYLKIRFDVLYSIYVVFLVAVVVRHLWKIGEIVRGRDDAGTPSASSGL